jgi:hypothetical protein
MRNRMSWKAVDFEFLSYRRESQVDGLSRNPRNGGCSSTARCLTVSQAGGTDSKHKDFVPFGDKASGNRFPLVQGTPRHIEKAITGTAVKKMVMLLLGPFV